MLKKPYRLPAGQKLKNPSYIKIPYFKLKYSKNELAISRFGFVVGKSLDKSAVVRNRCKRVLRSCIEEKLFDIKGGYDMLFFLEKDIIGKDRKAIFGEVKKLFKEKKLFAKD